MLLLNRMTRLKRQMKLLNLDDEAQDEADEAVESDLV